MVSQYTGLPALQPTPQALQTIMMHQHACNFTPTASSSGVGRPRGSRSFPYLYDPFVYNYRGLTRGRPSNRPGSRLSSQISALYQQYYTQEYDRHLAMACWKLDQLQQLAPGQAYQHLLQVADTRNASAHTLNGMRNTEINPVISMYTAHLLEYYNALATTPLYSTSELAASPPAVPAATTDISKTDTTTTVAASKTISTDSEHNIKTRENNPSVHDTVAKAGKKSVESGSKRNAKTSRKSGNPQKKVKVGSNNETTNKRCKEDDKKANNTATTD